MASATVYICSPFSSTVGFSLSSFSLSLYFSAASAAFFFAFSAAVIFAHGLSYGIRALAAWRTAAAWLASGVSGTAAFLFPFAGAGSASASA